jgi:hypothetical protein
MNSQGEARPARWTGSLGRGKFVPALVFTRYFPYQLSGVAPMQARINFTPPTTRGAGAAPLAPADIASYIVQRLPNSGGSWTNYATVPSPQNVVVAVSPGDAYQYRLVTVDSNAQNGPPSATVEIRYDVGQPAILPPDPPTSLSVTYLP